MSLSTRTTFFLLHVFFLGIGLPGSPPLNAQSTNAAFLGIVTDPKGEPMPGATVQVQNQNQATGFRTATATQADGRYQSVRSFSRRATAARPRGA